MMRFGLIVVGLFWLVAVWAAPSLAADDAPDRVVILVDDGLGRITISCRILDYTGRSITVRPKVGGNVREYDQSRVIDVQTPQLPSHTTGLEQFRKRELDKATQSFDDALALEEREWVRREILAMQVRCALRSGDTVAAGNRFVALATSDPETRHYPLAPLSWTTVDAEPAVKNAARSWRAQRTDAGRLIAASWLLFDAKSAADAESDLRGLSTHVSMTVATLARAQLWRKRLVEGDFTRNELRRWHERLLESPGGSRGGGFYVLGQAHRKHEEHTLAAACLLHAPLAGAEDPFFAARALFDAADSLARVGQRVEAKRLLREVVDRYAETPAAAEAARRLAEPTP